MKAIILMEERMRVASRRLLTLANLFENLCDVYGEREALSPMEPPGYAALSARAPTFRGCLDFTNLAAEAFIRHLDLKKGERVLLLVPKPAELLLIACALIKAGGIAVPLDHRLSAGEIEQRARGCGAALAVVDGEVWAGRADLAAGLSGIERTAASGPRAQAPAGALSLDKAMDSSSGFFLPYTLKPSSVVCLFHTTMPDGSMKAVMATNEGLLRPRRWAAPFFPAHPDDTCVCAHPPYTAAGFFSALLGMCMGLRPHLTWETDAQGLLGLLEKEKPAAVLASPEMLASLLRAGARGRDLSAVRLWFSAGGTLPRDVVEGLLSLAPSRRGLRRLLPRVVEAYDAGGNAVALAWKPAWPSFPWHQGCPGLVIPPDRAVVLDGTGRRQERGREGELALRGPAVTPGYWNDVEGTLAAKRGGWFHTGIRACGKRFLIEVR